MMDVEILSNYGVAGLILYVFYKLFSNELQSLKEEISNLREAIYELKDVIANWR